MVKKYKLNVHPDSKINLQTMMDEVTRLRKLEKGNVQIADYLNRCGGLVGSKTGIARKICNYDISPLGYMARGIFEQPDHVTKRTRSDKPRATKKAKMIDPLDVIREVSMSQLPDDYQRYLIALIPRQ